MTETSPAPLRIFADPQGHTLPGLCHLLQPFFDNAGTEVYPNNVAQIEYNKMARELFVLTDRSAAQVAVLPWYWKWLKNDPTLASLAFRQMRENAGANLKTLVFHLDDSQIPIRQPGTIVYRTSMLRRQQGPNDHALPAWANDFVAETQNMFQVRSYTTKPVVGFCGASYRKTFAVPSWFRRHFQPHKCQYESAHPHGRGLRAYALDQLAASTRIQPNIIERDAFKGGAMAGGVLDPEAFRVVREEYIRNLIDSDYALCIRGAGNYSFRLYEAMSLGRIPVFVNTDCVMPFDNLIPWRELCVWVEQKDLSRIDDIVAEQHAASTPEKFAERQSRCREVWQRHLSFPGFFATLKTELMSQLR